MHPEPQRARRNRLALAPHRKRRRRNRATHVLRMPIAAVHIVEIGMQSLALARAGIGAYVVDVALRAVEKDAPRPRLRPLERAPRKSRPVA